MNSQPRQPAGVSEGGRFTNKGVPDNNNNDNIGFNPDNAVVGPSHDWGQRTAHTWGLSTTFTRTVEPTDNGGEVTVVSVDCDDPAVMLLAHKNDGEYWSGNTWSEDHQTRRSWTADIAARMLEEGLVGVGYWEGDPIRDAMSAASSPQNRKPLHRVPRYGPRALTAVVAQIRGLRLLQSMAPAEGWRTKLGGYKLPGDAPMLLSFCFHDTLVMYVGLPQPPWEPDGVAWGPQPTAGHATNSDGHDMFVGENGDLVWKALTETDRYGWSPLTETLRRGDISRRGKELVVVAALYDETAQYQLTHGLFDVADRWDRRRIQQHALEALNHALNPGSLPDPHHEHCWTPEQTEQIHGFIKTVEGLKP